MQKPHTKLLFDYFAVALIAGALLYLSDVAKGE